MDGVGGQGGVQEPPGRAAELGSEKKKKTSSVPETNRSNGNNNKLT